MHISDHDTADFQNLASIRFTFSRNLLTLQDPVIEGSRTKMMTEESMKQARNQIYCCTFCTFIQENVGVENLDAIESRKYIFHLKNSHGLEP